MLYWANFYAGSQSSRPHRSRCFQLFFEHFRSCFHRSSSISLNSFSLQLELFYQFVNAFKVKMRHQSPPSYTLAPSGSILCALMRTKSPR